MYKTITNKKPFIPRLWQAVLQVLVVVAFEQHAILKTSFSYLLNVSTYYDY